MQKVSFIFLFFLPLWISAQNFWENIPVPDTVILCVGANDNHIFFGSAGGLFISENNGQSWNYVQIDQYNFNTFREIEVSESGTIYTGSYYYPGHSGLFKSSDNGQSWEPILIGMDAINGDVVCIYSIGDDTLFAAFTNTPKLIRTTNGGVSWEVIYTCPTTNSFITGVAINSTGDIYISQRGEYGPKGGVFVSHDNGISWQLIGLTDSKVCSIAIDSFDDVYVSCWGGITWDDLGVYVLRNGSNVFEKLLFIQSEDLVINEEDEIYITSSMPPGVYRSKDHGATFELLTSGFPGGEGIDIALDELGFVYNCTGITIAKSVNSTVDIKAIEKESEFNIFPNPSNGEYTISNNFKRQTEMALYNSTGQQVEKFTIINDTSTLNLKHLHQGIYFVKPVNGESGYKIIKQ